MVDFSRQCEPFCECEWCKEMQRVQESICNLAQTEKEAVMKSLGESEAGASMFVASAMTGLIASIAGAVFDVPFEEQEQIAHGIAEAVNSHRP